MAYYQTSETAKLFLSYSRRNSDFIDELIISVESYGFDVQFDRADLFPGEPWEPRLRGMISESDTTVCVLSNAWMESTECIKELKIALELGRRVIPVLIDPIDPSNMPPELARLQFIFFHGEGHSYARGVVDLIEALRTDIGWVREQTRLLDKASEWQAASGSPALLLRGAALESALKWINERPPEHTHILPFLTDYIQSSEAFAKDQVRKKARGRFWLSAVTGLAIAGVLGVAVLYFQNLAGEARADALELEREILAAESAALRAQIELAAADLDNFDDEVDGGEASQPQPTSPSRGLDGIISNPSPVEDEIATEGPSPGAPTPVPVRTPTRGAAPVRSPAPMSEAEKLVAQLNSYDKTTRIGAGQSVAEAVRGKDPQPVLNALIDQLNASNIDSLSSSGRFNILYMLNNYDRWPSNSQSRALTDALKTVEARSKGGIAIGGQTRDCIDKLRSKLGGAKAVGDRCG